MFRKALGQDRELEASQGLQILLREVRILSLYSRTEPPINPYPFLISSRCCL